MTLFGYHPKAKRETLIWRRPVGAPKVAAKPVAAPPRIEAKMVMTMDWRSAARDQYSSRSTRTIQVTCEDLLSPNSHPKNPVAKQEVFIVPEAQRKNMFIWWCQGTWPFSSGSFLEIASLSMPNLASSLASKLRRAPKKPDSRFTVEWSTSPPLDVDTLVWSTAFSGFIVGRDYQGSFGVRGGMADKNVRDITAVSWVLTDMARAASWAAEVWRGPTSKIYW